MNNLPLVWFERLAAAALLWLLTHPLLVLGILAWLWLSSVVIGLLLLIRRIRDHRRAVLVHQVWTDEFDEHYQF